MLKKLSKLKDFIKKFSSVVVAYSGGVDSSFLLYICKKVLGDNLLAVTATSETYTKEELKEAKKFTKKYNIKHIIIKTSEFKNKNFIKNTPNRCFYCKEELFKKIENIRKNINYDVIFDGTNYNDLFDFRPGEKAKKLYNIVSPLKEVKLTKEEIRKLSKKFGLFTYNKSHISCLASRVVFGEKMTNEKIKRVYLAEKIIKKFWEKFFRVRLEKNFLRIEINKEDFKDFFNKVDIQNLVKKLKKLKFKYITFDLEGYTPIGLRFINEKDL